MLNHTLIKNLLASSTFGTEVTAKGWVRTRRGNKNIAFIALNDGSTINSIQVVAEVSKFSEDVLKKITTGCCLAVTGDLVKSQGQGQTVEIQAKQIEVLGEADAETFPLQKKEHTMEFLREIAHLRPRTNTFGAVFRIRHHLAFAIHKFFNDKNFYYLHTPIITGSDAEGAGEMFHVTTFDLKSIPFSSDRYNELAKEFYEQILNKIIILDQKFLVDKINNELLEIDKTLTFEKIVTAEQGLIDELSENEGLKKLNDDFRKLFEHLKTSYFEFRNHKTYFPDGLLKRINPSRKNVVVNRDYSFEDEYGFLCLSFFNFKFIVKELRSSANRVVDYSSDFFGKETNLTVSGQLEGELGALALGLIYTFGPTFRAENSNTPRHLAEFWMIEPEMAFYEISDNMDLAEEMLKYLITYVLEHCADDLNFLNERYDKELLARLHSVTEKKFTRITYTTGVEILNSSGKKFEFPVSWGVDLQKEHETFLVEHYGTPVIITDYPKDIKAFYMKQNDDGKTVRGMDILFPWIGEIIGGSQREEELEKLQRRIHDMKLPEKDLWWYLDTRKFGTCVHSGFGLGFERLVLFVTGMSNIRDVIPFPRTPKNAEF